MGEPSPPPARTIRRGSGTRSEASRELLSIIEIACSPGKTVATAGSDETAWLWDVATGQSRAKLTNKERVQSSGAGIISKQAAETLAATDVSATRFQCWGREQE